MSETEITPKPKQKAPTLYVIIAIKLVKGVSLLLLALGVYRMIGVDLSGEFQKFLLWINLDPEGEFFSVLANSLRRVTPENVRWVATGAFLYSVLSLVEGVGLMFRISWVGWLVLGESAFFIPLEVYKLLQDFTLVVFTILVLNIVIVIYLYQNRDRLFRHYRPAHH